MVTADIVRKLALAFPEAIESSHFNVVDFRVRKKIFATIHPGGKTGVLLRLDSDQRAALADAEPETYQLRGTALQVVFANISVDEYKQLLTEAWRGTAPKRLVAEHAPPATESTPKQTKQPATTKKPAKAKPRKRTRS